MEPTDEQSGTPRTEGESWTPQPPEQPAEAREQAELASDAEQASPAEPVGEPEPGASRDEQAEAQAGEQPQPEREPEREPERHGPRILIDVVEGDFTVRGGAPQVILHAHDDEADDEAVREENGTLRFAWLPGHSELRVPHGSEVEVRRVEGDLSGQNLDGILMAHHVGGDASFDGVAAAEVLHVDGDLHGRRGGLLRARIVSGDVDVDSMRRTATFFVVAGDLKAADLPSLELRESVGGDAEIDGCGDVSLLGTIGGDLDVNHSVLTLHASAIGGDAKLSAVRQATIAAIGGDLTVTAAQGPVEISSVGGDARVRRASARIRLGTVGGDLDAEEVRGGLAAARIGGDADLDTPLGAGAEYLVHAAGDITLRVRGEVNARFVAQTSGGEIQTRLPLAVEKGRRRNLVGVLGRGDATVTLRSDGGDISIAATDRIEEEHSMGDEFVGRDRDSEREQDERSWEGTLGGRRFRVRWDRGPGRAGFHFQGPYGVDEDPDAMAGGPGRDFKFEWEKGQGARMSGEYEERLNELRDRAERVARRATEEAQRYAEKAAKRARETDWEAVGREVRSAFEKAMGDLEDAFSNVRRDWETRRPTGAGGSTSRPSAQRVKIEYDDDPDAAAQAGAGAGAGPASQDDADAQRRDILEQLRSGAISLDEAERRLNDLR